MPPGTDPRAHSRDLRSAHPLRSHDEALDFVGVELLHVDLRARAVARLASCGGMPPRCPFLRRWVCRTLDPGRLSRATVVVARRCDSRRPPSCPVADSDPTTVAVAS